MQTVNEKTARFNQRRDNLVDLDQFRRGLSQRDSLARWPEPEQQQDAPFCPVVLLMSKAERRRARRERRCWTLDLCASLAVVLMTLIFSLRVIL